MKKGNQGVGTPIEQNIDDANMDSTSNKCCVDSEPCIYNRGLIGKTFDAGDGETAVYVNERVVRRGFCQIIRCIPRRGFDHVVWGKKSGGVKHVQDGSIWVAIGQPYPMSDEHLNEIREYCEFVGLSMEFIGDPTHAPTCWRIVYKKSEPTKGYWGIAIECGRWHTDYYLMHTS